MTIDEQIRKAVADAGNYRNALNLTMADLEVANTLLKAEQGRNTLLLMALEGIRALIWPDSDITTVEAIDRIACKALELSGQIPTHTTKED